MPPDDGARDRPAVDADAEPERLRPRDGVASGDRLQLVGQLRHRHRVLGGVGRGLFRVIECFGGARACHDIPLADVLVLEHARPLHGHVEVGEDVVHQVENLGGEGRPQQFLWLDRAEHDGAFGNISSRHILSGCVRGKVLDDVVWNESAEEVAVLVGGPSHSLGQGECVPRRYCVVPAE